MNVISTLVPACLRILFVSLPHSVPTLSPSWSFILSLSMIRFIIVVARIIACTLGARCFSPPVHVCMWVCLWISGSLCAHLCMGVFVSVRISCVCVCARFFVRVCVCRTARECVFMRTAGGRSLGNDFQHDPRPPPPHPPPPTGILTKSNKHKQSSMHTHAPPSSISSLSISAVFCSASDACTATKTRTNKQGDPLPFPTHWCTHRWRHAHTHTHTPCKPPWDECDHHSVPSVLT